MVNSQLKNEAGGTSKNHFKNLQKFIWLSGLTARDNFTIKLCSDKKRCQVSQPTAHVFTPFCWYVTWNTSKLISRHQKPLIKQQTHYFLRLNQFSSQVLLMPFGELRSHRFQVWVYDAEEVVYPLHFEVLAIFLLYRHYEWG